MLCHSRDGENPFRQREALITLAQDGDLLAQRRLADLYRIGDELTQQDYPAALKWYRAAAQQGDPCAQNDLGSMFLNALGISKDAAQAAQWYFKAAQQGLPTAQFNYALRCLSGDGLELDIAEAVVWLTEAAQQGHTEATGQLGTLFRFGRGVERNYVTAASLHVSAAIAGDITSIGNLADYREHIEKAALNGSLRAALSLSRMYDGGLGVEKNMVMSYTWLLWGKRHGRHDDDERAREDLYQLTLERYSELTEDNEAKTYELFADLLSRSAGKQS